jgi:hypothetical protein
MVDSAEKPTQQVSLAFEYRLSSEILALLKAHHCFSIEHPQKQTHHHRIVDHLHLTVWQYDPWTTSSSWSLGTSFIIGATFNVSLVLLSMLCLAV